MSVRTGSVLHDALVMAPWRVRWTVALNSLTLGNGVLAWAGGVQADIRALGELAPNWDGYGAPAIDPAAIEAAAAFVAKLPGDLAARQPRVVPTANGMLQLEWHAGARSLELEFESPHSIRYLQWNPDEGVEEEDSFPATDVETAVDLIRWFMTGDLV
jgi:hypothetical protein